jgi:hypothetical protein
MPRAADRLFPAFKKGSVPLSPLSGAPIASIGGTGTFDGIFLSGIVAVLLT